MGSRALVTLLALSLAMALCTACGADDAPTPGNDTTDTTDTTDTSGGGQTIFEPPGAGSEFPDCITGCANDAVASIFEYKVYNQLEGRIDGDCHDYAERGVGGDTDIIGLKAPGRTMLEITVAPAPGSAIDPLIETHSGARLMTYGDARADGDVTARTTLAAPTVNPIPFYIVVYDARNYDVTGADCSNAVGGDNYGYILTVREIPFAPTDLGELPGGGVGTSSGTLQLGGDTQYFMFHAPATSEPTVTITSTGSEAFIPTVAGMTTIGGDMAWQGFEYDQDGDGVVFLPPTKLRSCATNCGSVIGEWAFAVLDWQGMAWPGTFSYDVRVDVN